MCLIQVFSDVDNCGVFKYLDEDMWLEKNGCYLLNIHMLLDLNKDVSNISVVVHGSLKDPKACSLYSKSWNATPIGINFSKSFFVNGLHENSYEDGYEIIAAGEQLKIEGSIANVVPDDDMSFDLCDMELKECTCIRIHFKNKLLAGSIYAMRIGFYIVPPQSIVRYIANKMEYLIHYYSTFSLNAADSLKIIQSHNTIPANPKNSSIFIFPPPSIKIINQSVSYSHSYQRVRKPFSEEKLKKPLNGYRWHPDKIMKTSDNIVTGDSNVLSFTFRHFDPGHPLIYISLFISLSNFINKTEYLIIFLFIYVALFILVNHTFVNKFK